MSGGATLGQRRKGGGWWGPQKDHPIIHSVMDAHHFPCLYYSCKEVPAFNHMIYFFFSNVNVDGQARLSILNQRLTVN